MKIKYTYSHYIKRIIVITSVLALVACNRFGSEDNQADTISGNAVKGVISNGLIQAFDTNETPYKLIASTITDAKGDFSIPTIPTNNDAVILLRLTTDEQTRMRCDLVNGCSESQTGALIPFGSDVKLPEHFSLEGVATPNLESNNTFAFISPVSHIIISTAAKLPEGLTSKNIKTVSDWFSDTFNLSLNPLELKTADITNLDSLGYIHDQQLYQSILSAALYQNTLSTNWSQGNVDLNSLDLPQILNSASELAAQISGMVTDENNINALSGISSQTADQLQDLMQSPLTIVSSPQSTTVTQGNSFSLNVQASSEDNIIFQWFKDGQALNGATAATYNKIDSTLSDSGIYHVVASTANQQISSLNALVSVNETISEVIIVNAPLSTSIVEGATAYLSVEVSGDGPISYQWQKEGSVISGATSSSLTIQNSKKSDEGSYRVNISNSISETSSDFVNIWVSNPTSPVIITGQPQNIVVNEGANAQFSVSAEAGGYISYQWRKNQQALNDEFASDLTLSSVSIDDAGEFDVVISNSQGSETSQTATLTVIPKGVPVSIVQQPKSQYVNTGETANFNVQALGDGPFNYQWILNDSDIIGANESTYSITNAATDDQGIYSVNVSNNNSSELSISALLTVEDPITSVILSWVNPTEREDGSSLSTSDIEGYLIAFGNTQNNMSESVTINNPLATTHIFTISSTLYVKISTIDTDGQVSQFSDTISISN